MSSILDDYYVVIYNSLVEHKSNPEIVKILAEENVQTSETSVRRCIERHPTLKDVAERRNLRFTAEAYAESEGVDINGDSIIITAPLNVPVEELLIDDILRKRKLDPEEWEVKQILDNQWEANAGEGKKITLYQFKIWLSKKVPVRVIFPATVGPELPTPIEPDFSQSTLGVICGDHQAPFINKRLHKLFLRWLALNRPDFGVINGDLLDNGNISRHRDNPEWDVSVQKCIQSAFDCLYEYRQASTGTSWRLMKGNHDDRIRSEQLERSERLYGITAAQWPGDEGEEWVFSLNHLLHLKKLGIEYVEPRGTYEFQQVPLSTCLSVRHGHYTGKDAPIKTLAELGHSVILGHTHRQSIGRKTFWNSINGSWNAGTVIESGCMCDIEGGLGYANAGTPDWQPGFATITMFPDGNFTADLAFFQQEGVLRWRDQIYEL